MVAMLRLVIVILHQNSSQCFEFCFVSLCQLLLLLTSLLTSTIILDLNYLGGYFVQYYFFTFIFLGLSESQEPEIFVSDQYDVGFQYSSRNLKIALVQIFYLLFEVSIFLNLCIKVDIEQKFGFFEITNKVLHEFFLTFTK